MEQLATMLSGILSHHRTLRIAFGAFCMLAATALHALDVEIKGNLSDDLVAAVEGGSLLVEVSQAELPPETSEILSAAQADYRRVLAILYDNGYFGPEISIRLDRTEANDIAPVSPPSSVSRAIITVKKGKQFTFGAANIEPVQRKTVLPEAFRSNEVAKISAAQAATRAVIEGWRDAGFAKAQVRDQTITARHGRGKLDVNIAVSPGPKLRFGNLTVDGDSAVRTERILEIAGLPVGQQYSPDEVEDATTRLRRTGSFRAVALLEGDVAPDGETLPFEARVVDNKPRRFGFGGEYATIEGLTLSGFWLHRNLFGGAERLRFEGEIGGIGGEAGGISGDTGGMDYLARLRFDRPATFNQDTNFYSLAEIEREDEPNFFSRQVSAEVGIERFATDERTYRFGLGFRRAITEDALGSTGYTIFLLPSGLTFDYRNSELDARRGYYADATLTPFYAISGTDSGLLSEVDLRGYHTFGKARPTTVALRMQLGSLAGPSLENAPADFLFYSGGGGTVRGHDYQSLGVQVGPDEDDIIGGRSFLGLSAEVRMRTAGSLGFVAFADAGYIGSEAFPDGAGEWHSGAGLGARYATPIGPIRFDVAVPTSGDTDGENFYLYFGIGHAF